MGLLSQRGPSCHGATGSRDPYSKAGVRLTPNLQSKSRKKNTKQEQGNSPLQASQAGAEILPHPFENESPFSLPQLKLFHLLQAVYSHLLLHSGREVTKWRASFEGGACFCVLFKLNLGQVCPERNLKKAPSKRSPET